MSVFDIREFQLIISCSPHKAPLSQTAILIMIFSSKTGNYDRSVEPVLHIKASNEPIWCVCTTPNGLEWSPRHYFRVTPRSLRSFCGAAAPGHRGLTASSVFFFSFFSKLKRKKATIFDVLERYSRVKWTMALQIRVTEAAKSFTNI